MALGAFLIVAGVVYGVHARDYEGLTLSLTVAGGALLFGGYGGSVLRRARATLTTGGTGLESTSDEEPHVGPTIWPLVFAVSAIGLVIGAVSNRWALLPGGVLFVSASVGWVLDVHRQWHHHAAGVTGHGSGVIATAADAGGAAELGLNRPVGSSTGPAEASTGPTEADPPGPPQGTPTDHG